MGCRGGATRRRRSRSHCCCQYALPVSFLERYVLIAARVESLQDADRLSRHDTAGRRVAAALERWQLRG
jgi:hypothetical protein